MIKRRPLLQIGAAALAAPSIARAQAPRGSITLMGYSGIFQDNYTRAVVEPFQRAFPDVKVNYAPGGTSAQMLGKLRAQKADPQVDVAIMDVTTSTIGNAEGLFAKFTPGEAPSLNELYPEARAVGGEFGPAVTYDHLVIVYDTQNVKPPPAKLADLWRADLKGQLPIRRRRTSRASRSPPWWRRWRAATTASRSTRRSGSCASSRRACRPSSPIRTAIR